MLIKRESTEIILDAYNANPTSMKAALKNLSTQKTNKIAILGDMFELGEESNKEHLSILNYAKSLKINKIYTVGNYFYEVNNGKLSYKSFQDLKEYFKDKTFTNDTILIKGSRGMQLERLLEIIC